MFENFANKVTNLVNAAIQKVDNQPIEENTNPEHHPADEFAAVTPEYFSEVQPLENQARGIEESTDKDDLQSVFLGKLFVPTGEIVACDPLSNPDRPAFNKTIPAGHYSVDLYLTQQGDIALACLRVTNQVIARWEMALTEKQATDLAAKPLAEGQYYGYSVDAGLGCFMDKQSADLLQQHEEEIAQQLGDKFISYYDDVIDDLMEDYNKLVFQPYTHKENNVIMFRSGFGDGYYGSYWGMDADGNIACLVTDFGVLCEE